MLHRRPPQSLVLGAVFIVAGELMFVSMGVGIRFAAEELSNELIVFFRNLFSLLLLAPWFVHQGRDKLRTNAGHLHLLRGVAGVSAMYCFFYAIANIPLADAMLLKLSAPLFVPIVALLWLHEAVTPRVWLAVAVGFGGVFLILSPAHEGMSTVALIAVLGGFFAAIAKVTVRRLSQSEPSLRIVFYFALTATLVSCVPLLWSWQTPSVRSLSWLLAVAACATIGQLCLTRGLSLAPASRMGTFGYFSVVFGAGYGWLLWGEMLMWWTLAGTGLIVAAGMLAASKPPASLATDTAAARPAQP